MRKRILSLCLTAAIVMGLTGLAASASETAGEGASTEEAASIEEEQTQEEVVTDAAGNVITPETAQAIDNPDLGVNNIVQEEQSEETETSAVADGAEEAMQAPETDDPEMTKSTIGAAFDSSYQFDKEDAVVYLLQAAEVKAEPSDDAESIASLDKYSSIRLTGSNQLQYWEVRVGGTIGYLDSSLITREQAEIEALKEDDIRKEENEAQSKQEQEETLVEKTSEARDEWAQAIRDERRQELASQTRSLNWNGARKPITIST